ncbi:MAG: hypothetical protein U9Q62_04580 [Campylobacterota bacterium]|nr:hypothetical protein [Campylobacterota bacterium]
MGKPAEVEDIGNNSPTNDVNEQLVTKRVALSEKNITLLKTMSPLYENEAGSSKESDLFSFIINQGIRCLFDTDYKDKINNL